MVGGEVQLKSFMQLVCPKSFGKGPMPIVGWSFFCTLKTCAILVACVSCHLGVPFHVFS